MQVQFLAFLQLVMLLKQDNRVYWQREGTFYHHSIQVHRVRDVHHLNRDGHRDDVAHVSLFQVLKVLFHNQFTKFKISMCLLILSISDKSHRICYLALFL